MERIPKQLVCHLVRFEQPLALLGLFCLASSLFHTALSVLSGFRYYIFAQWFPPDFRCYGQWAVVMMEENTLSYFYAEELARKHMYIQLIGFEHDEKDLKVFADRLRREYHVKAQVLTVRDSSADILECIKDEVERLDSIGILVNQLPMRPSPVPITQLDECDLLDELTALILTAYITKFVARKMVLQERGVIINISDCSGDYPHPFLTTYSGASVFMDYFSKALNKELSRHNVQVQSLVPYPYVQAGKNKCTLISVPPRLIATHAVNTLGQSRSRGHWWFGLRGFVESWVPLCWRQFFNI